MLYTFEGLEGFPTTDSAPKQESNHREDSGETSVQGTVYSFPTHPDFRCYMLVHNGPPVTASASKRASKCAACLSRAPSSQKTKQEGFGKQTIKYRYRFFWSASACVSEPSMPSRSRKKAPLRTSDEPRTLLTYKIWPPLFDCDLTQKKRWCSVG
jgi:hypothetical protein